MKKGLIITAVLVLLIGGGVLIYLNKQPDLSSKKSGNTTSNPSSGNGVTTNNKAYTKKEAKDDIYKQVLSKISPFYSDGDIWYCTDLCAISFSSSSEILTEANRKDVYALVSSNKEYGKKKATLGAKTAHVFTIDDLKNLFLKYYDVTFTQSELENYFSEYKKSDDGKYYFYETESKVDRVTSLKETTDGYDLETDYYKITLAKKANKVYFTSLAAK